MNPPSTFYGRSTEESGSGNDGIRSLLETINCSLSEMQRQLYSMQEQNLERDTSMKKILCELEELKKEQQIAENSSSLAGHTPKRSRKSPRGLSVSTLYNFLPY